MKISELLEYPVANDDDVQCITNDNRELDAQTWWLAAKGVEHHALDYYRPSQPCAGVIYEPPYTSVHEDWIAYPHLHEDIGNIAARFYGKPSQQLQMIGITGTDGKSSFVHMMAQMDNTAMIGTIGIGRLEGLQSSTHTTPDAFKLQRLLAKMRDEGIRRVAMEVSSHSLSQHRVEGVAFHTAIFTNLTRDHLDYHGTMEAYFQAKVQLFHRNICHAIVNVDDIYGRKLIDDKLIHPSAKTWAVSSHGYHHSGVHHEVCAESVIMRHDGLQFDLVFDGRKAQILSPLLGRFNVDNLLNVAASLLALDYSFEEVVSRLPKLTGVPGRVEAISLGDKKLAIVDYAHTPAALANAIEGIRSHIDGRLWVVFGCGGDRDKGKRPMMADVAERLGDEVVVTDDNPRHEHPEEIIADIKSGLKMPDHAYVMRPRDQAITTVLSLMKPGDAVLIAGKGHETYQIIGDNRYDYSDQKVVKEWLVQHGA